MTFFIRNSLFILLSFSPFRLFAQSVFLPLISEENGAFVIREDQILSEAVFPDCGFDLLLEQMDEKEAQRRETYEQAWQYLAKAGKNKFKSLAPPYTLPVVVHIIHQNGAENISDAQVQQAIQYLNDAFANVGYYDPATGVSVPISFCLAVQDPDGNLTTGINHLASPWTDVNMDSDDLTLKNLIRWEPLNYINIWVVREICSSSLGCGVAGYAYFPSAHGGLHDGIVVEAGYMGSSEANTSVLIHEMGHYLGLYHTFEGGCTNNDCTSDGDRICDTPPDNTTTPVPCGTDVNSCSTDTDSGFATDQNDLYIDYMDYSHLSCYSAFTQGQSDRMVFTVEGVRSSLLESPGCQTPCMLPLTADFSPGTNQEVEVGTTLNFSYTGTGASNFNWTVDGVSFGLSANASYTFLAEGVYTIELQVGNGDPNCQESMSITVIVKCLVVADFEASSTNVSPGTVVYFTNYSQNATSYTWLLDGAAVGTGTSFDYLFDVNGTYDVQLIASNGVCSDTSALQVITVEAGGIAGTGLPAWPMVEQYSSFSHAVYWQSQPPEMQVISNSLVDITATGATGAAFDACGELAFFVAHTGSSDPNNLFLYAPDGTELLSNSTPNGPGLNAVRGPQEIEVVRVPGYANEWFIIYDEWSSDGSAPNNNAAYNANHVAYSRVRYQNGVLTVLEKDVLLADATGTVHTYNDGKAVSRTAGGDPTAHYLYLARRSLGQESFSLDRFLIVSTGIFWDANTGNVAAAYFNLTHSVSPIELSPQEDKIAVINRNSSSNVEDIFIFDAAVFSNAAVQVITGEDLILVADGTANDQSAVLPYSAPISTIAVDASLNLAFLTYFAHKLARIEFSPNGRFLYVANGGYVETGYTNITYLAQIDLEADPLEVRLQIQAPPGGTYNPVTGAGCPFQQCLLEFRAIRDIQASYDGKLYFSKRNGNVLYVIPDPNNIMPQNLVPSDIDLSTPDSPNLTTLGTIGAFPDQIDGFNYLKGSFQQVDVFVGGLLCDGSCRAPFELELWNTDSLVQNFVLQQCPDTLSFCADTNQVYRLVDPNLNLIYDSVVVKGQVVYPIGESFFAFDDLDACTEICGNGLDDDGDGLVDCEDPDLQDSCCCYVAPVLDAGPDQAICEGATAQFQATPGFELYLWSDLVTQTPNFTAYGPGVYWVQAQDACGIWHSDTVEVSLLPQLTLDLGPDIFACQGETVSFAAEGGFDLYEWIPAGGLSCSDCPNPTLMTQQDTGFILVAHTLEGCYSTDTIFVEFLDTQLVYLDTSVCEGSFVVYEGELLPPGSVTPFVFTGANGCDSTVIVQVTADVGQGSFEQIDTSVCMGSSLFYQGQEVMAGDSLTLSYTNTSGCDSVVLIVVNAIGIDTTEEYVQICQGDSVFFSDYWVFEEGTYSEVFTSSTTGCDSVHLLHLSFFDPIQLGVNVQASCPGQDNGSVEVEVYGGDPPFSFFWSNGLSGAKITDLPPGNYEVTVTDVHACQSVLGVAFEDYPAISYDFSWDDVSCFGAADGWIAFQTPDEGLMYSLNGGPFQSDTLFSGLDGGDYELLIQDANGCFYEEFVALNEPPAVVVSLPEEIDISLGESVVLNGEVLGQPDTVLYSWVPPLWIDCFYCPSVVVQPLETMTYELSVTTADGCVETASTLIRVSKEYPVYIPTAFSPNGDGLNDKFFVFAGPAVSEIKMFRIFDRWGDLIYEAAGFPPNAPEYGWDGTYRSKPLGAGLYTYYVFVEFIDGSDQIYRGGVHLVR